MIFYIACSIGLLLNVGSFCFHVYWNRKTTRRERKHQQSVGLEALTKDFVTHFSPSLAVSGYKFKGEWMGEEGVDIGFQELGLTLKGSGQTVLDGVTGKIAAGRMVAVMGPSGCGKTTFLNVLCGKATYGTMTGEIRINGQVGNMHDLKSVTGFVPQEDVVHEKLTVREQIEFSAKLRNDYRKTRGQLKAITEDVLHILQIDHVQRSIVGGVEERGISGGQRKRVNIALELAASPILLFLDEPTSGLDSTSSLAIINSLKKMTSLGMTIIMVIHQPRYSLFNLFDQVLLLGKGGHTVYTGSAPGSVRYFEGLGFPMTAGENAADWLMDVISGEVKNPLMPSFKVERLFDRWKNAPPDSADAMVAGSALPQAFDKQILAGMVNEEWDKIDSDNSGYLDVGEMQELLASCGHQDADKDLVQQLMSLVMSSQGPTQHTHPRLQRQKTSGRQRELLISKEMLDYFLSVKCDELLFDDSPNSPVRGASPDVSPPQHALQQRVLPGVVRQYVVVVHRRIAQFWRNLQRRLMNVAMTCITAGAMAYMHKGSTEDLSHFLMFHLGLAMMIAVSCLPVFADRPIIWREISSGVNIAAFCLARMAVDAIDVATLTIIYAAMYWTITYPPVIFALYLIPCMLIAWTASGFGYFLSAMVPPSTANLTTVLLMLVLCGIFGTPKFVLNSLDADGIASILLYPCMTRWTGQMFFVSYYDSIGGVPRPVHPNCSKFEDVEGEHDRDVAAMHAYQAYMFKTGLAEKTRWSYYVYTERGICRQDEHHWKARNDDCYWYSAMGVLLLEGVVLRILSFLSLRHQAPDATMFGEKARSLCCRNKRCQSSKSQESDDETSDDDNSPSE